jgi:hypothetical protein
VDYTPEQESSLLGQTLHFRSTIKIMYYEKDNSI